MKKYPLWIIGGLLLIAAIVAIAKPRVPGDWDWEAQHHRYGWHRTTILGHLARELDLSDSEKSQIRSIWAAEKPNVLSLLQTLAGCHREMEAATRNGTFDEAKVREITDREGQAVARLLEEKERLESLVYNEVLTPAQRAKVDRMRARFDERLQTFLHKMEASD
jgi:Spy/CpxP family protein refolding chaperone